MFSGLLLPWNFHAFTEHLLVYLSNSTYVGHGLFKIIQNYIKNKISNQNFLVSQPCVSIDYELISWRFFFLFSLIIFYLSYLVSFSFSISQFPKVLSIHSSFLLDLVSFWFMRKIRNWFQYHMRRSHRENITYTKWCKFCIYILECFCSI